MTVDLLKATTSVTAILEQLGVQYFISGSLASTLYGMVRTTQGSDLVACLEMEHVPAFIQELEDTFYMDEEMIQEAVSHQSSFNIIHRESFFKVDIFIPVMRPFLKEQFSHARRMNLGMHPEIKALVASPEDTLLAKLEWFRMGGEVSEIQWRDVLGVLKVQAGMLDLDYMDRMAIEIGVRDLFEKALKEV